MNLLLRRLKNNGDTTLGTLKDDHLFINMFTLEDEPRADKVAKETRIPAGTYEILERKVLSPMTNRYRAKYPWFKWHLELQQVPNFKNVYIHIGNTDEDTAGCILVGESTADGWAIGNSRTAFTRLYHYIMGALNAGERVFITIIDEKL